MNMNLRNLPPRELVERLIALSTAVTITNMEAGLTVKLRGGSDELADRVGEEAGRRSPFAVDLTEAFEETVRRLEAAPAPAPEPPKEAG